MPRSSVTPPAQARGDARRADILQASLEAFLEQGYLATNVEVIAATARASKRTIYAHFGDKQGLFREVIRSTIAPMQQALDTELSRAPQDDAHESLLEVARSLTAIIVTPSVAKLRRVIIAEADRFPDLAAEWYHLGPEQTVQRLAAYLRRLAATGQLRIDDSRTAAEQLLWLAVSVPLNRLMFAPSGTRVTARERRRAATNAVDLFWRAYGSSSDT